LKQENFYLDICKNLLHDTGIKSKIIKILLIYFLKVKIK